MNSITINDLPKFKKSYDLAVDGKKEIFIFKGSEVLTTYAKYVIEYFETLKVS